MIRTPYIRAFSRLVVLICSITLWTSNACAQFKVIGQSHAAASFSDVNLFLEYGEREAVTGILVSIPADWEWKSGVKRSEKGDFSPLRHELGRDGKMRVWGTKSFKFGDVVLIKLKSGRVDQPSSLTVAPFVMRGASVVERTVSRIEILPEKRPLRLAQQNEVGEFGTGKTQGWVVDLPSANHLTYGSPYSVSMWTRTTEVNELLLSTWSGEGSDDYPFEWVVDPAGYLEFYRGFDSKHVSMRSTMPIADGNWHFLTMVYDPEGEWTKLSVDGEVVDSLYHVFSFPIKTATQVALGSRLSEAKASDISSFSGQMDDFRISPSVWTPSEIVSEMKRPSQDDGYLFDFEKSPSSKLVTASRFIVKGAQELDISVDFLDNVVVLKWETVQLNARSYIVERSRDGQLFDPIAEVLPGPGSSAEPLTYTDVIKPDGVVYYRLKSMLSNGLEETSQTVKLGMGDIEPTFTASLKGNYPNPFNPSTTIEYDVLETQTIRISVWDLSGQMISTLVDGTQSAGQYEVSFTATDLPSGTYFVRMESDSGIQSHQILLMK
ncbi:T9SS type A sorting domain-containing protein [bacterium]|nr:T9SS type A sorting domain-containing protein [bacterium]